MSNVEVTNVESFRLKHVRSFECLTKHTGKHRCVWTVTSVGPWALKWQTSVSYYRPWSFISVWEVANKTKKKIKKNNFPLCNKYFDSALTQTVQAIVRLVHCGAVGGHRGRNGQPRIQTRRQRWSLIQLTNGLAKTSHRDAALTQLAQTSGNILPVTRLEKRSSRDVASTLYWFVNVALFWFYVKW